MRELERGCDVLVATPGRVNDMVLRGRVSLRLVQVPPPRLPPARSDRGGAPKELEPPEGAPKESPPV